MPLPNSAELRVAIFELFKILGRRGRNVFAPYPLYANGGLMAVMQTFPVKLLVLLFLDSLVFS